MKPRFGRAFLLAGCLLLAGTDASLVAAPNDPAPGPVPFEIFVDPAQSILGPGTTSFEARIRMRGAPTEGLFSYGVRLTFPPELLRLDGDSPIVVPAELDHNGPVSGGALRFTDSGIASVKGTVDLQSASLQPYLGDLLATVRFSPVDATKPGSGLLALDFFRTLGSTESIFVTGAGGVLDAGLKFTGGSVLIVPEPGTSSLLGLGLAAGGTLWWAGRKCSQPAAQPARVNSDNFERPNRALKPVVPTPSMDGTGSP